MTHAPVLRSRLFWVGILYFAEGFPLGVFYEIFPVYFRQQGVELKQIGVLSLLGLSWTVSSSDPAGGEPQYIPHLTRAGVAAGVDVLFLETHPDPPSALCDAASMLPLSRLEALLEDCVRLHEVARQADARAEAEGPWTSCG